MGAAARRAGVRLWWRISWLLLACALPAGAVFELTGRGARSTALGGALVASASTAEAVWYNPAGNARQEHWHVGSTHALLYPALERSPMLNGLAVAGPLQNGGFQAGLSFLGADGWREEVIALGYGRALNDRLALGGGLRTSAWKAGDLSHRAWSMDLGGTWEVGFVHPLAYMRVGVAARGLNSANFAIGGQAAGEEPRSVVLAAAIIMAGKELLIDLERNDGRSVLRLGYETRTVSLSGARFRVGGTALGSNLGGGDLRVGLGHDWKDWNFDYAYSIPVQVTGMGGIHRVSVGYRRR